MTFYKAERKRIGGFVLYGHVMIIWLCYFLLNTFEQLKSPSAFGRNYFLFLMVLLVGINVHRELFFMEEQGKHVPILKKYEIIPVRRKTMIAAKIRMYVKMMLIAIAGLIGIRILKMQTLEMEVELLPLLKLAGCLILFAASCSAVMIFFMDVRTEGSMGRRR